MESSLLQLAEDNGRVLVVLIGGILGLAFDANNYSAIDTRNLNECSMFIIVSPTTALLAHIPPRSLIIQSNISSATMSVELMESYMTRIIETFNE
jgi:hypothetical protein